MNNIKWIKIACNIFDDEAIKIIEQMPDGDSIIVIWLKLLISAGKINDGGLVYFKKEFPYTDEMLATVFNRPINTIRLAIQTFEKFGMIQITNEQQIFITNWEEHQNIAGMEQVKEYNRLAKQKQRKKAKELKLLMDSQGQCQGQCQGHVKDNHETEEERRKKKEEKEEDIFFNKGENKKIDPYINPIKKFVIDEYTRIFKTKPFLSNQDCLRIVELSAEHEDIKELITIALTKLKSIKFDDINFKPSINWLLKSNNFERVLNGEFENEENEEKRKEQELREKMKREGKL